MTNLDPEIYIPFAVLLGLLVGSFLNVVIYRLPVMLEKQWRIAAKQHLELPLDEASDVPSYLREGAEVQLQFFDGRVIAVDLPTSTPLKVEYTEDVVKGNTTSSVQKDAKLETGITIKVPAFIKNGDVIKVDTRDGSYIERMKD